MNTDDTDRSQPFAPARRVPMRSLAAALTPVRQQTAERQLGFSYRCAKTWRTLNCTPLPLGLVRGPW